MEVRQNYHITYYSIYTWDAMCKTACSETCKRIVDTDIEYEYDANGNMVKDFNRKISSVSYNLLNLAMPKIGCTSGMQEKTPSFSCYSARFALSLPSMINFTNNSYIEYTYSATGEKLKVRYGLRILPMLSPQGGMDEMASASIEVGEPEEAPGTSLVQSLPTALPIVYHCGNVVYDRGTVRLLTEEGYVTFSSSGSPQRHYFLRDHLGNIRVVMDAAGNAEQVNHFYAFGGLMRESEDPGVQPLKYGDKELDRTYGLDAYDFGARMYFADRLQWGQMDPLCEKYYDWSPYAYCFNNPVLLVDPDGRDGMITGQGTKEDPYVVTAVYYYQIGALDKDQISGLNAAISDYNNLGGKDGFIVKVDGVKSYVKFNLSAQEVDNPKEARQNDTCFNTAGGVPRYYGNIVGTDAYTGEEYGSANCIRIDFNVDNINNAIEQGLDRVLLNKGVASHEIGHNLGGEHSDKTPTMSIVNTISTVDIS